MRAAPGQLKSPNTNCSGQTGLDRLEDEGKKEHKISKRETKNCVQPRRFEWCDMKHCRASSELDPADYGCQQAFGIDKKTGWASNGEGVGAWIKAFFKSTKYITKLKLLQRNSPGGANKRVTIEFRPDIKPKVVTLEKIGNRKSDYNIINLYNIRANYLKITITDVYGQVNNGFQRIEIFGCD